MKWVVCICILIGVSQGRAQDQDETLKKRPQIKIAVSSAPVTSSEARSTFVRAESVLRAALAMPTVKAAVSIADGEKPVARDAIISEMARMLGVFQSKVKMTPRPVSYDSSRFRISPSQLKNLMMLVRKGAVARLGPLATGPENTLTVPQFGDAIGFFMARVAQITHLPSSKWTPYLRPENSD